MADSDRSRGKSATPSKSTISQRPPPTVPPNMEVPDNLQIKWSGTDSSKPGIIALGTIPAGIKFGPYGGEKVVTLKKDSDPLCIWEIVDLDNKEFLFYLDATKLEEANWLRHVQCARFYEEQNLMAEQEGIDIMYTTLKPICKGEELLTWYKVPTTRRGQRPAGRVSGGKASKSSKDMPFLPIVTKSPGPKRASSPGSPKKKPAKIAKPPPSRTASPLSKSPKKEAAKVDTKPAKEDTKTSKKDTKSAKEETKSAKEVALSAKEDCKSTKDGTRSVKDDDKLAKVDTKSAKDVTKSAKEVIKSTKVDSKSAKEVIKSTKEVIKYAKVENNSAKEDSKSAKVIKSAKVDIKSTKVENKSAKEDIKSAKEGSKSANVENKSAKEAIKCTKEVIKSTKKDIKSAKVENKCTKEDSKSAKVEIKSAKEAIKSTKQVEISVEEESKPAKEGTKSAEKQESISIKEGSTCSKEDSKFTKEAIISAKSQFDMDESKVEKAETTTPVKAGTTTPVKGGTTTPVKGGITTPIEVVTTTPVKALTMPAKTGTTPIKAGTTTPIKAGTTTPIKAGTTTPIKAGTTTPVKGGKTTPVKGGISPPVEVVTTTPVEVGTATPVKARTMPVKTGMTPIKMGTTPVKIGSTPVKTVKTPVKIGSTPVKSGSTPVKSGSMPVKAGSTPVKAGTTAVKVGSMPVKSGSTPVKAGSTPVKAGSTPVKANTTPLKEGCRSGKELESVPKEESKATVDKSVVIKVEDSNAGSLSAVGVTDGDKGGKDKDRDSSDQEMDLDEADDGDEDDDDDEDDDEGNDSDSTLNKGDCGKSTQSDDPEKFHFKLKKTHITKGRQGRKVFKCDICAGIYKHAFSLKRHYIRNHINLKYVSRGDILNCQINPETHDSVSVDDKDSVVEGAVDSPSVASEKDTDNSSVASESKVPAHTDSKVLPHTDSKVPPPIEESKLNSCNKQVPLICDNTESSTEVSTPCVTPKKGASSPCGDLSGLIVKTENSDTSPEQASPVEKDDIQSESGESCISKSLSGLYRCNVCSSFFDSVTTLKSHLDNHPNAPSSKAFACDQCDMKFAHKQNLRRHLAVHTGEKPFTCKFCGKTFPTATNQKRHERIHLGRRVACEYCSSTFTQSGDLKKHIRKLHPECFHECAFCGKYFTDEEDLIDHVVSHNQSMQSNEAEKTRRKQAFKVDMELDRIESMRLAEQKTPGVKFACTVCKKRFLDYANMCRHRRLAHQRHLLLGVNGSNSSSPVPSPTKLASDSSDGDPQAFFYANVANNISENLTNYLEGTKEDIEKTANQMKLQNQARGSNEKGDEIKPKVEIDQKDIVKYNFPTGFSLQQNYRKIVPDKEKSFDKVKSVKVVNSDLNDLVRALDKSVSNFQVKASVDNSKNVTDSLRTGKSQDAKMDKLNKVNKEDKEVKPVISMVNGVNLNIPVFNLSNIAKRDSVKVQPVCTVQPIQRQTHSGSELKPQDAVPAATVVVQAKKGVNPTSTKSIVTTLSGTTTDKSTSVVTTPATTPPPATVKLVNKATTKSTVNKASPLGGSKPSPASSSCLALKIPQVHVCPVCRRLFNNEVSYHKHMMDKHKTTPEEAAAQKEQKDKMAANISHDLTDPVMDLSGKSVPSVSKNTEAPADREKAIIDHDEGARLLLDFALGIRDEPQKEPTPVVESKKSVDDPAPLDLSSGVSGQPESKSSKGKKKSSKSSSSTSVKSTVAKTSSIQLAVVSTHSSTRAPAAHTGQGPFNQQGKVQGLLRIPNYTASKDLDLPAPLTSPPGTPRSPWQPQLPSPLCAPFTKTTPSSKSKKFICTVCYGEFPSRGSLHAHQRATHTNVRCDHVEVDTDVVAPWWQKPSPVGMLNVCSSQMSEYNETDQKQQLKCTKCQRSFGAVEDLHSHIFECASIGKRLNKPKPKMAPASKTMLTATTTPHDEAAAVAAAGLRLLAASQPRLPLHPSYSTLSAGTTSSFSTPCSTGSTYPAASLNPGSSSMIRASTTTTGAITAAISSTTETTSAAETTLDAASSASMLERFKNSILKKMKKKKKRRDQEDRLGLMTKKRRRSLELLYNPQNHVRRREMTEVVDMQRCQGCGQRFTTISLLERHIPFCTQKDRLKDIQVIRNPLDNTPGDVSESRNLCHYCSKQFTYAGMLRKHVFEVCQMRKYRIQEFKPLDVSWEQELALHYTGPADTYSNDGSQLDDTASIATSTSSSHDNDSTGNRARRRKRKNRGWGNGKKKRSSTYLDASSAADLDEEEDIDEDLECNESLSDIEDKRADKRIDKRTDKVKMEVLSVDLGESSQSGDELKIVEDASPDIKETTPPPPLTTPEITTPKAKTEPIVKTEPPTSVPTLIKSTTPKEIPKQNTFIGRHALPVVLSVPQYRERTPLTVKPKPNKVSAPCLNALNPNPLLAAANRNLTAISDINKTQPKLMSPIKMVKPKVVAISTTKPVGPSITTSASNGKDNGVLMVTKSPFISDKKKPVGPTFAGKTMDMKPSMLSKLGNKISEKVGKITSKVVKRPVEIKRIEVPAGKLIAMPNKKLCLAADTGNIIQMGKVLTNSEALSVLKSVVTPKVITIKQATGLLTQSTTQTKPLVTLSETKATPVSHNDIKTLSVLQNKTGPFSMLHKPVVLPQKEFTEALRMNMMKSITTSGALPHKSVTQEIAKADITKTKVGVPFGPTKDTFIVDTNAKKEETFITMTVNKKDNKNETNKVTKDETSSYATTTVVSDDKVAPPVDDSEESSDEEDIKEIINTVLAQRKNPKPKTAKGKKQKKAEPKTSTVAEKPAKASKTAAVKTTGMSDSSPNDPTGKTLKQVKLKSEKDTSPSKTTKTKTKKKTNSDHLNGAPNKAMKKEANGPDSKSEDKKAAASPQKKKKKTAETTTATSDDPPTKKKKLNDKTTPDKGSPNKVLSAAGKVKTTATKPPKDNAAKKLPITTTTDKTAASEKTTESPPNKVHNKTKLKNTAKKGQSEESQTKQSPNKNRKRKATDELITVPSGSPGNESSPAGPSPSKQMKTRGGLSPTTSPTNNAKIDSNKTRRASIRGGRLTDTDDTKSPKAKAVTKTSPAVKTVVAKSGLVKAALPKLKRSISATATKKTLHEEKSPKARTVNGKTPMRTRQSRLSL